jgi:hypothetical protein
VSAQDDQTHAAPARYVVVGGGDPTAEQLAALTVALTPVAIDDETEAGSDRPAPWVRAVLMENVGRRPLVSADDLAAAPPLFA